MTVYWEHTIYSRISFYIASYYLFQAIDYLLRNYSLLTMWPFKKKTPEETLENTDDNIAKKGIKTMDTVVTGMILGGIIASLYGVKKLRDKKGEHLSNTHDDHQK